MKMSYLVTIYLVSTVLLSHSSFGQAANSKGEMKTGTPTEQPAMATEPAQPAAATEPANTFESTSKNLYGNLKLSKQQKKQILEIKKTNRVKIVQAKNTIKSTKQSYQKAFDLLANDQELTSKFKTLQSARQSLADARFEQMLAIRSILNEDQKKKFHEMKSQRRRKAH